MLPLELPLLPQVGFEEGAPQQEREIILLLARAHPELALELASPRHAERADARAQALPLVPAESRIAKQPVEAMQARGRIRAQPLSLQLVPRRGAEFDPHLAVLLLCKRLFNGLVDGLGEVLQAVRARVAASLAMLPELAA